MLNASRILSMYITEKTISSKIKMFVKEYFYSFECTTLETIEFNLFFLGVVKRTKKRASVHSIFILNIQSHFAL